MNTTTTTIRRRIAASTVAAVAFSAFAACGTEVTPPAQEISHVKKDTSDRPVPMPTRTTGNRLHFGDENGTAHVKPHTSRPAGSGTRNRMDFRDDGW